MVNINTVYIAGNLTRDPETKTVGQRGRVVASFGLAINRTWRDQSGEKKEETTFVDVEAWGRTAELVGQHLTKGRSCLVEGRLKLNEWDDQSGNKRRKLSVVADRVHFLDRASGAETYGANVQPYSKPPQGTPAPPAQPAPAAQDDDEPPF